MQLFWLVLVAAMAVAVLAVVLARRLRSTSRERRRLQERALLEDALKRLLEEENHGRSETEAGLAGHLGLSREQAARITHRLRDQGLLDQATPEGLRLSPQGREYARHVLRAHRLWERYLADHTGLSEAEWHRRAEELEHRTTPEEAEALSARLGHPTHDPHGDPVPSSLVADLYAPGKSLAALRTGEHARISHIEDEPPEVFRSITEKNLAPGMQIQLIREDDGGVTIATEAREVRLQPAEAANITVVDQAAPPRPGAPLVPLSALEPGQKGIVRIVSQTLRAPERRRLLDLGLVPGTEVVVELRSPMGDPTAYRVRGAMIALRNDQAAQILVEPLQEAA
ncbi:MAG: hypothetical protein Kow00109_27680 [Acidobacteriota bacterium]